MAKRYPQAFCCHEAGHAVVAFSLGVRVVAVSVFFTEKEGWKGYTKTEGTDPPALEGSHYASHRRDGRPGIA